MKHRMTMTVVMYQRTSTPSLDSMRKGLTKDKLSCLHYHCEQPEMFQLDCLDYLCSHVVVCAVHWWWWQKSGPLWEVLLANFQAQSVENALTLARGKKSGPLQHVQLHVFFFLTVDHGVKTKCFSSTIYERITTTFRWHSGMCGYQTLRWARCATLFRSAVAKMSFGWDLWVNVKRLNVLGRSAGVFSVYTWSRCVIKLMCENECRYRFGWTSMVCMFGWVICMRWNIARWQCKWHRCCLAISVEELLSSHKRTWEDICTCATSSCNAKRKGVTGCWMTFSVVISTKNCIIPKWQVGVPVCVCVCVLACDIFLADHCCTTL